jgi:hypothetical protein
MAECLVALDRLGEDGGTGGDGSARELRLERAGDDGSLRPAESAPPVQRAETRTRAECYEAARAGNGRTPDRTSARADAETDRGGWSGVDAADRPPADGIRVTPERTTHILDGDGTGGGHRHGVGKPRKTEFPASWSNDKIITNVLDVARRPDSAPTRQDWNDTWLCRGTRNDVGVSAVVERDGNILTGWPEEGSPGVVRNPRRGRS